MMKILERILGLSWNTENDTFEFNFKFSNISALMINGQIVPTKRQVLKNIITISDPIGFLSPVIVQGRLLLQEEERYWMEEEILEHIM